MALPAYREHVLAVAPGHRPAGHCQAAGRVLRLRLPPHLGLIEINNAGGDAQCRVGAWAQRACCTAVGGMVPTLATVAAFEHGIVEMFSPKNGLSG